MIRRWLRKPPPPTSDATKAREQAERDLEAIRRETPYYRSLGDDLRAIRERNHLAESIRRALREA